MDILDWQEILRDLPKEGSLATLPAVFSLSLARMSLG